MLWTEINKTQPGGLRQPFLSFQGIRILQAALHISIFGDVYPADCTGEQNYPKNASLSKAEATSARLPGPMLLLSLRSSAQCR